jgi:hypothetical protein
VRSGTCSERGGSTNSRSGWPALSGSAEEGVILVRIRLDQEGIREASGRAWARAEMHEKPRICQHRQHAYAGVRSVPVRSRPGNIRPPFVGQGLRVQCFLSLRYFGGVWTLDACRHMYPPGAPSPHRLAVRVR